jgi:hypothetical protein
MPDAGAALSLFYARRSAFGPRAGVTRRHATARVQPSIQINAVVQNNAGPGLYEAWAIAAKAHFCQRRLGYAEIFRRLRRAVFSVFVEEHRRNLRQRAGMARQLEISIDVVSG